MSYILVTGGAVRLGAAISLELAKNGHNVAVHYKSSKNEADALVAKLQSYQVKAEAIYGDFTTVASTDSFIQEYQERFRKSVGLVNNIGNYILGPASETCPKACLDLFHLNVNVPLMLIKALMPDLKDEKGSVVNIGMAGCDRLQANTYATAYNLTKMSLCMLTKSYAKELAPYLVRVNMVSPGYLENSVDLPATQDLPMKRYADLEEVARAVLFFMDQKNAYVTGQNMEIGGGVRL